MRRWQHRLIFYCVHSIKGEHKLTSIRDHVQADNNSTYCSLRVSNGDSPT